MVFGEANEAVQVHRPNQNYRGAVVGCGQTGSTIDHEHIHQSHNPWPYAVCAGYDQSARDRTGWRGGCRSGEARRCGRRWAVMAIYEDYRELIDSSCAARPCDRYRE